VTFWRVAAALDEAGVQVPEIPEVAVPELPAPDTAVVDDQGFGITTDGDGNWRCGLDEDMSPRLRARFEEACRRLVDEGGESFGREFADNFSVMMLVFIPIVAGIMKGLYLFARRKTVKYVTLGASYFVAFMFTLLGLIVYTALTL
jgi:hypothetical protein